MWVVDKSLPRPNGHQDGYWSFQEASACALQLCRFQIGPGQNWEMWYVWKTWENWFYFRWMKYDEVVVFRPVTRHAPLVAIEFRKYVYEPCDITGKVHLLGWVGTTKRISFFSGRLRGNRVQSGGSQITVRSIGHRRREHDYVPIRPVDGPGQSEMVLETEHAT